MFLGSIATLVGCLLLANPDGLRLEGTIADEAGRPVAGAKVSLVGQVGEGPGRFFAEASTGDDGTFAIPRPAGATGRGPVQSWTLWVDRAGYRASRVSYPAALPEAPIRVVLGPPAGAAFRVEGPDRQPIAGVSLRVIGLDRSWGGIPDGLARRTLVTTDADGRAVIDAFASDEINQVEVQADGFGVQPRYFSPISSGPKTIRLRPTGRVSGRLVADDPTAVRGWSIYAST